MCAHIAEIDKFLEEVEKQIEVLHYSRFRIYKELRKKSAASELWLSHVFGPRVKSINEDFSKKYFLESQKRIQKLTDGQFANYKLLLDAYHQSSLMPCDLYAINKINGGKKTYTRTLFKNFSLEKKNRGNEMFFHLIEKIIEPAERPKKTKKGQTVFTRNIAFYSPKGFFRELSFITFYCGVAARSIFEYWKLMEELNKIELSLNQLKQSRNPLKSIDERELWNTDIKTKNRQMLDETYREQQDYISNERIKAAEKFHFIKNQTASRITEEIFSNKYSHEEFISNMRNMSQTLYNNAEFARQACDEKTLEIKQEILEDIEGTMFSYDNVLGKQS